MDLSLMNLAYAFLKIFNAFGLCVVTTSIYFGVV